jgi:hypothetical protein
MSTGQGQVNYRFRGEMRDEEKEELGREGEPRTHRQGVVFLVVRPTYGTEDTPKAKPCFAIPPLEVDGNSKCNCRNRF